ncbi:MAG: S41 family peptidase [Labilithrix sp.]|nr:S41 family peptidase [Labilithrix sp.]MCW5814917.1 S41 family peptidase [Labilithrix sp.]
MKLLRLVVPTVGAFAGGLFLGGLRAEATPAQQNPYEVVNQLGRVLVQVENHYVDPAPREKLVEGAIKGMVDALDPHSSYLPAEEWKQFQSDTEGKFGGVGIEVDGRNDKLIIIAPIEGSPAQRAGIKSGDQIVGVDGEDVLGQPLDKVVKRMRGAPGTKLKITVLREAKNARAHELKEEALDAGASPDAAPPERQGQTLSFELTREIIHVSAVLYRLLDGNVGYLRIKQFQERTHAELLAATAKMRQEVAAAGKGGTLQGILLDLRSNPGGLVDEATEIADEFLASGGIYSMRHRGQVIEDLKARSGGAFVDMPTVALVNEWSASASELLVGALQDNKRATVVGANTFGKGSVQSILPLPNGAGLKLTTARYYTPSGHAIQADGIHPDVVIEPGTRAPNEPAKVLRERDLPGHLPAEGPQGGNAPSRAPTTDAGLTSSPEDEVIGSRARDIPFDPSQSRDVVLRVGYQTLRTAMSQRSTLTK